MKALSVPMLAWYAKPPKDKAYCIEFIRPSDAFAVRGTSWDEDLTIDGLVFYSTAGGSVSDIASSAALSVDNAELHANFDSITSEYLKAGLWDGAEYSLFAVNPSDLTMGRDVILEGSLAQITIDRIDFASELFSRMQSLQQAFGHLIAPTCPYNLGDDDCTKDISGMIVTGTADGVSPDGLTWLDSARTEAGPAGGVAITSITSDGDETVVHIATPLGVLEGGTVTLSNIVGPVLLSGPWQIHSPSGTTFRIVVNSSDTGLYPAFVSGTATPEGAESGWFDYGTMEITGGGPSTKNHGLIRRIKSSLPRQWTLQREFPFPVDGTEDYELTPGDDKLFSTCKNKFANQLNFGGEPNAKSVDWMAQVGRAE